MMDVNSRPGPLRVGLDLLCLAGPRTGIEAAAWWLAREMPRLAPDIQFVFFLPPGIEPPSDTANVEVVRVPLGRYRAARIVAEQWRLPVIARGQRLDLLHAIAFATPWLYGGRKLQTVHDLGFLVMPGSMPRRYRTYWKWAYGTAARCCSRLTADSEFTRSDLVRFLGWDPARITVVPCGVDTIFTPAPSTEELSERLRKMAVPRPYVLFVGTLQPRKGVDTLIETFARIRRDHGDLNLVIAGARGWGYPNPGVMARQFGVEAAVQHRSGATLAEIADLYRGARLLLCPSRYEGFGLPPLEAMACGTPVVATETSSLPEVCGDAALFAPVDRADLLAEQAKRILSDPDLARRLVAKGTARAAEFTWPRAATRMISVYRRMFAEAPAP
jgi:glycosyltransferase involved in cell wall biosynthesis